MDLVLPPSFCLFHLSHLTCSSYGCTWVLTGRACWMLQRHSIRLDSPCKHILPKSSWRSTRFYDIRRTINGHICALNDRILYSQETQYLEVLQRHDHFLCVQASRLEDVLNEIPRRVSVGLARLPLFGCSLWQHEWLLLLRSHWRSVHRCTWIQRDWVEVDDDSCLGHNGYPVLLDDFP